MNGDSKDEAHRPRPLSAGIWTLFSWLRRSERSSSCESLSSVGSARTAVSFDFLAPGNCNITNTPIALTTPINPPTETYKRRLQDRNLRRQRDRGITLHRKYGLFRENVNGYDGLSLPPTRRITSTIVNRANRDRRATSECLQRRAAYVPGKRRAPLPPTTATSVTLPRTYKRKRPAPKPPVKNTSKDNNNTSQLINDPVRMNSNTKSEAKSVADNELFKGSKSERCDQKVNSRDTKSRTDKSFLKNIFENRKRNSVTETISVRLLPSISELDKQAAEIIKTNKLRQNKNDSNPVDLNNFQDTTTLYEGNTWFCTSCLRKYDASINSCSYCLIDENQSFLKNNLKSASTRSSIYTQTKKNIETAPPSQRNVDERQILKEILKEMKDSLPKKDKDNKVKEVITEVPTLRIGSTVPQTYKDLTSQPSSSRERFYNNNQMVSTLSQTQNNIEKKQSFLSSVTSFDISRNNKITAITNNEDNNLSSTSNQCKEKKVETDKSPNLLPDKFKNEYKNPQEIRITNISKDDIRKVQFKDHTNVQNTRTDKQSQSSFFLNEKNDNKDKPLVPSAKNNCQNQNLLTCNEENPQKLSKIQLENYTNSLAVVINTVTVVTSHSNDKLPEPQNKKNTKHLENNFTQTCTAKVPNDRTTDLPLVSNLSSDSNLKGIKRGTYLEHETNFIKTSTEFKPSILHTPLKISSLLNPLYSPTTTIAKKITSTDLNASKQFKKEVNSFSDPIKTNDVDKACTKSYKEAFEIVTSGVPMASSNQNKDFIESIQTKKTIKLKPLNENLKEVSHEQMSLPSTSGCSSSEIITSSDNLNKLDLYDRRRYFINQLEQSIAKGDEVAAAEAAVKLAKLRLSCSVLSFSSQIVGKINDEKKILPTSSPNDLLLAQNTPHASPSKIRGIDEINKQEPKNEKDNILKENIITNKYGNNINNSNDSNIKSELISSRPSTSSSSVITDDIVPINIWIEDKQAARGPIRLNISRQATMADIKRQAEYSLGLPTELQRWIVGRTLCADDTVPIASLAGSDLTAPFYLCLVQPDKNPSSGDNEINKEIPTKNNNAVTENGEFYTELIKLEKQSLVLNIEPFECGVCMEECATGAGVVLRECIHTFCRECLSDVVQHCQEPAVACPAVGCSGYLQEREIRTIVTPEEYERWLARGLATAESGTRNTFHCRTRDCKGWAFCDPGVRRFPCPVCENTNCVQCQAIHEGDTCDEYQKKLREAVSAAVSNKDDEGTQALLNSLISRGEALECPECKAIITKKWGCDWVKCSACKTEICWITKGKRWGPGGRGDISGGCRCGVDGQRCHPSCGYCH